MRYTAVLLFAFRGARDLLSLKICVPLFAVSGSQPTFGRSDR